MLRKERMSFPTVRRYKDRRCATSDAFSALAGVFCWLLAAPPNLVLWNGGGIGWVFLGFPSFYFMMYERNVFCPQGMLFDHMRPYTAPPGVSRHLKQKLHNIGQAEATQAQAQADKRLTASNDGRRWCQAGRTVGSERSCPTASRRRGCFDRSWLVEQRRDDFESKPERLAPGGQAGQ